MADIPARSPQGRPTPPGTMITVTRLVLIVAIAAPVLAWAATGSASAAWAAGIAGGAVAYLTRWVAHAMRGNGRS